MNKCLVIAEIASSHNQDLDLAKALINAAAKNGADIVKFQDWRASNVSDKDPDKKRYERYQFPEEWYTELIPYCKERGVEFLTTCVNADRAKFLADLGLKKVKIASISLTNYELLIQLGAHFEELIVSTAFHSREEIEEAIDLLQTNAQKFTILACTGEYPCPPEHAGLERMNTLREMVRGIEYAGVGYSCHVLDLDAPRAAIAMGAEYLEVHFSLSRYLPQIPHQMYQGGPKMTTHMVSLEPHELKELSNWRDKVALMKGMGEFKNNEVEEAIKSRYKNRYGR